MFHPYQASGRGLQAGPGGRSWDNRVVPPMLDPQHPGTLHMVFGETSQSRADPARPGLLFSEYVVQVSLLFEHSPANVGQSGRI